MSEREEIATAQSDPKSAYTDVPTKELRIHVLPNGREILMQKFLRHYSWSKPDEIWAAVPKVYVSHVEEE